MLGQKTNSQKYPDADRQPRHLASFRIREAKERQEAYDLLTLEQKLACLPPEPKCAKQRAKLLAKIDKRDRKPQPKEVGIKPGEVVVIGGVTAPPKYMKNV